MARLFLGQKESDFFSDIAKELIKDVAGQKIFYYRLREDLTSTNDLYEESDRKIFNPPVALECLVEWNQSEVKTSKFGHEVLPNITVFMHARDLLDRNLDVRVGDYFSYGENFFEATSILTEKLMKGQIERVVSYKMTGKIARSQHINVMPLGPTSEKYYEEDATQTTFEQQRGMTDTDLRYLQKDEILEKPITGPAKVAPDNTRKSINNIGMGFYGDDE